MYIHHYIRHSDLTYNMVWVVLTVTDESTFIIKSDIVIWHKPWCKYCYQLNMCTDPGLYKFTIRTKRKRTESANETNEKRTNASHDRYQKRTIHEANARYTKRTHDTRNECMIHETNARCTKPTHATLTNKSLERTCSHILSNDKPYWFYRGTI